MKKWIVALAAVALLGGCIKMDKTPPTDLPPYVTLYPGAQPMMRMNMGVLSAEVETTSDTPDAVIAYYRGQAAANGLTEKPVTGQSNPAPGEQQVQFGDANGGKILVVSAKPQNSLTLVTIGYQPAKAASQ